MEETLIPDSNSARSSPASSSPASTTSPLPLQWPASPIRIRDSAARPRRSLLSAHFSGEDGKIAKTEESPVLLLSDELSKSLPSLPVLAFLDKQEEEALEPTTPPSTASFAEVPMAPRKCLKQRPAPRGKHRPRRLLFGDGDPPSAGTGDDAVVASIRRPIAGRAFDDAVTPPRQSFNSFASATSTSSAGNSVQRLSMRDLQSTSASSAGHSLQRFSMRDLR